MDATALGCGSCRIVAKPQRRDGIDLAPSAAMGFRRFQRCGVAATQLVVAQWLVLGCAVEQPSDERACQRAEAHVAQCTGEALGFRTCEAEIADYVLEMPCGELRTGKADNGGFLDRIWCHYFGDMGACENIMRRDEAILVDDDDGAPFFYRQGTWRHVSDGDSVGGRHSTHRPRRVCEIERPSDVDARCAFARWDPRIGFGDRESGYYLVRLYFPPGRALNDLVHYTPIDRWGWSMGSKVISQQDSGEGRGWKYLGVLYLPDGAILRASVFDREVDFPTRPVTTAPFVADAVEFIPVPHLAD